MRASIILVIGFWMLSCNSVKSPSIKELWNVTTIVDGDTFWAERLGSKVKFRLIGLDAPESRKTGRKEIGYYGKESGNYLDELIKGKKVILEYDVNKYDQYGRTLVYVFLEDGTFVNGELISRGYARVMTFPPNVKYADEFVRLQKKARRQNKGLWNEPLKESDDTGSR